MSRNRTGKICPRCKKPCYFEMKPTRNNEKGNKLYQLYLYAVHYDSVTHKRTSCYIGGDMSYLTKPISNKRLKDILDSPYDRTEELIEYDLNDEQIELLSRKVSKEDLKQYMKIKIKAIKEEIKIKRDFKRKKKLGLPINNRQKMIL